LTIALLLRWGVNILKELPCHSGINNDIADFALDLRMFNMQRVKMQIVASASTICIAGFLERISVFL
jgi:hypothetical protein